MEPRPTPRKMASYCVRDLDGVRFRRDVDADVEFNAEGADEVDFMERVGGRSLYWATP